jgi:drug/metabolite transporter (DMT)-like permease
MSHSDKSRTTLWAFLALSLVWGASFLFMKVGLDGLSPAQVVVGRILLGAATLAVIMTVTRRRWPREKRVWAHMIVVATFFCVVPFTLFAWDSRGSTCAGSSAGCRTTRSPSRRCS